MDRASDDKGRWRLPGDRDVASASDDDEQRIVGPPGYITSPAVAGIVGARRERTVLITSVLSIPWQVDGSDAEVGVSKLALDHV